LYKQKMYIMAISIELMAGFLILTRNIRYHENQRGELSRGEYV
jgi:hypothetical protein